MLKCVVRMRIRLLMQCIISSVNHSNFFVVFGGFGIGDDMLRWSRGRAGDAIAYNESPLWRMTPYRPTLDHLPFLLDSPRLLAWVVCCFIVYFVTKNL